MRLVLACVIVVVCAASCAPGQAEPPEVNGRRYFGSLAAPAGQVLRFNLGSEPELRDPGTMSGQPDGRFARLVFEGLTTSDPRTLEPRPGQAYRWETSADGLTYTFHLRPGLAWADGTALTSRDFLWSWLRVLEPATAARNASLFYSIRGAEDFNQGVATDPAKVGLAAPDDSTFVVTLSRPTAYFLFLTTYYAFLPVPRTVVERWGIRWTLPEHLVGNGPFRWTHWRQNDRYEFVPSENYWDRKSVRLEKLVAFVVDDLSTSTNLYKSGAIDWNPSNYIPSQYLPYLKDYADFRRGKFQSTYFYSVNCTRRPFNDPWVRRALDLAIDRDAISRDLLKGSRDPWGRITPMGYPGYDGPKQVTFDPAKARACPRQRRLPRRQGLPEVHHPLQHQRGSPPHRRGDPGDVEARAQDRRPAPEPGVGLLHAGDDHAPLRRGAAVVDRRLPRSQLVPAAARHRRRQQPQRVLERALRRAHARGLDHARSPRGASP
jgi:ABC-type oligopeptide transport system substrate-binding subunit